MPAPAASAPAGARAHLVAAVGAELRVGGDGGAALGAGDRRAEVVAAVGAELAAEGHVLLAVGAADLRLRPAGHGLLQHARDHHAQAGAGAEAQAGRCRLPDAAAPSAACRAARRAAAAGSRGEVADGLRGLELEVPVHASDRFHARTLVDALLHLIGRGDGVDDEVHHRQAVLGEVIPDARLETGAQLVEVARQVEHRVERLAEDVGQTADDEAPQEILDLEVGEDAPGADDLDHEQLGIGDLEGVDAVGAQPDHLELGIPEQDGLGGAPLEVGEGPLADEVDLACGTGYRRTAAG